MVSVDEFAGGLLFVEQHVAGRFKVHGFFLGILFNLPGD